MSTPVSEIRKRLLRKASVDKNLAARVATAVKHAPEPRLLTASQRADLLDVIRIVQGAKAEPPVRIDKMPGYSPMQLRAEIDRLQKMRTEMAILEERINSVAGELMKEMEKLATEEKAGLARLKKAGEQMGEKHKYVVEAETALLKFTAFAQAKVPGIEQMLATPDNAEFGDKAGDLLGRIGAELGAEVAKKVGEIYDACSKDLTHMANAVRGLSVVSKTSSLDTRLVKSAGLADTIVSIREWLAGKADAIAQRILGFAGDIEKWFKGFVVRTGIVKDAVGDLKSALDKAKKSTEKVLASA